MTDQHSLSEVEARLADIRERVASWDKAVAGKKGDGWAGLTSGRRFIQEDFPFLFDLIASERAQVAAEPCPFEEAANAQISDLEAQVAALEAERDVLAGQLALERAYGDGRAVDIRVAALVEAAEALALEAQIVTTCICDEAYTKRGLHEPNTVCGHLDNEIAAVRAALASLKVGD